VRSWGRSWGHIWKINFVDVLSGKPLAYTGGVRVVWDEAKNVANQKKHRVSFDEASALFASGADYLENFDDAHSEPKIDS
jgi:hypothetical protein